MLQFTGAALALLPLQATLVWAYAYHTTELRWLAARDQTYLLTASLDWCDAHTAAAQLLAALWLVLQVAAVLLGCILACCPAPPSRQQHTW